MKAYWLGVFLKACINVFLIGSNQLIRLWRRAVDTKVIQKQICDNACNQIPALLGAHDDSVRIIQFCAVDSKIIGDKHEDCELFGALGALRIALREPRSHELSAALTAVSLSASVPKRVNELCEGVVQ